MTIYELYLYLFKSTIYPIIDPRLLTLYYNILTNSVQWHNQKIISGEGGYVLSQYRYIYIMCIR